MRDSGNYWARRTRISRRRAIGGGVASVVGMGALSLVGCGNDDDDQSPVNDGTGDESPLPTTASGGNGEPQHGGIMQASFNIEAPSLDALGATAVSARQIAPWAYSRLLKPKVGVDMPATGELEGDAASEWEEPDENTLLMHLRPGLTFDEREPTSGRDVTADDVLYSWGIFAELNPYRQDLLNELSEFAPVTSVEAVDDRTVQFNLAFPFAPLQSLLASALHLYVMPTEAESEFDPVTTMRGSGPWMLEEHRSGVGYRFLRNPQYYDAPRPYFDEVNLAIIPETATLSAQFTAGNVYRFDEQSEVPIVYDSMSSDDVVVLTDLPQSKANPLLAFGMPDPGASPFADPRVRQALSMLIDREAMLDVFFDREGFESAGLPTNARVASALSPGWGDEFYLDPRGGDFGENAQYYEYNPEEAQALLQAASFPFEEEIPFTYFSTTEYGRDFPRRSEALIGMLQNAGLNIRPNVVDYDSVWRTSYVFGGMDGTFEGLVQWPAGAREDPGWWLYDFLSSHSQLGVREGLDPELDELIVRQLSQTNRDERIDTIHDIQREHARSMVAVPILGASQPVSLIRPWLKGGMSAQAYNDRAYGAETYPHWWLDESQR